MKVKELIEALSEQDPDTEVYFSHDSRDYWGTVLASPVGEIEEREIRYSGYHEKYAVPKNDWDEDDSGEDSEEKRKLVVLLS